ncbi:MAG TPA: oligosaccharide flippase family protein [Steroidobacteraceae bacterium]
MRFTKLVNLKGDLFATTASFCAQAVLKLCASLILTRILRPEAYGIITILTSVLFAVEMLADLGVNLFVIRDPQAEEPRYLNTAWTIRLGRALLNGTLVLLGAPLIAGFFGTAELITPLRVLALWFVLSGLDSMSFPIATRRKCSRIVVYSELIATFIATVFSILYCYYSRSYWGMIYATLINRLVHTVMTYRFYPELRPRLHFDRAAATEILRFTRFTMPSSILTLALTQFDKIVFLRLFSLDLLGVYGLAGNIAGPVESLIMKISQLVLYPRCAHNYRTDRRTFSIKYYTENAKLFVSILIMPAAVGGAAQLLISALYDYRYAAAANVLQALMLRAALLSLASPAEDLLIAAGETQVILVGNVLRAAWMLTASLAGYFLFGFTGFVYGAALAGLPPLLYYYRLQRTKGFLIVRYELYKMAFTLLIAVSAYGSSSLLLSLWPAFRLVV